MVEDGSAERLRQECAGPRVEVARRLGVDPATLLRWERGISVPRGRNLTVYSTWLSRLSGGTS